MERDIWGLDVTAFFDLSKALNAAKEEGFNFICVPLFHPRFKREFNGKYRNPGARPDIILPCLEWRSLVAGKISPYIDPDCLCCQDWARNLLQEEINYGNHLDLPSIVIPLRSSKCYNMARIINSYLSGTKPYQICIKVPLISSYDEAAKWRSDVDLFKETEKSTWKWWNIFWTLCNYDKRLGVMLEVTRTLPSQKVLNRWMGEPVRCIAISTSVFITNKLGYPILLEKHKSFIKSMVRPNIQVVIQGNNHHDSYTSYIKYINYLWQEGKAEMISKTDSDLPVNSIVYPLQPLTENLVCQTYTIFETDSVKYKEYSNAILNALEDRCRLNKNNRRPVQVMIIGAGRGPLVLATIEAARKAQCEVKIYAIERNPFAVLNLQALNRDFWGSCVKVIGNDVRELDFPRLVDIIVSELLGSFGDNELSPEVLDGAQKFLREDGISIPERYTSYICPVQGSEIYGDLKESREISDCETPYVVEQRNKYNISKPQRLFTFRHPNTNTSDNARYKELTFNVDQDCALHGFVGYFDAVLYKGIKLSIVPEEKTPKLSSWNPIFFPLHEPVCLKAGDKIRVHFWRVIGTSRVWYEWTITEPVPTPIHNPNGRSSHMSLQ